jgi:glycosyltransferase involved in cell wall biosynthesis
MKILHITPHLGGGVGTVIMDWLKKDRSHSHRIVCLDYANEKAQRWSIDNGKSLEWNARYACNVLIKYSDIVVIHYWDHPMLKKLLSKPFPPCRLVIWCHNNSTYTDTEVSFPDLWLDTSPIQGNGGFIWSTGDISRFLEIKPKAHEGFNIGYIGTIDYKKMHPQWARMSSEIAARIPEARFTVIGDNNHGFQNDGIFTFTGKVDDVAPYLAEMDVFGYPLRIDQYGTCEQVLGEAMAAGVVPVVMNNPCEREIIFDSISGVVCSSGEEYIHWVEALYHDHARRSFMQKEAKHRASYLYSIDTMISKWNDVFNDMMKQPKRERSPL